MKSVKISKSQKEIKKELDVIKSWAYHLWAALVYKKYRGKCAKCGSTACDPHHIFPKGSYPHLKYDLDNGIMLCRQHHDDYHFKRDKDVIAAIIRAVGVQEYTRLTVESKRKVSITNLFIEKQLKALEKKAEEWGIV